MTSTHLAIVALALAACGDSGTTAPDGSVNNPDITVNEVVDFAGLPPGSDLARGNPPSPDLATTTVTPVGPGARDWTMYPAIVTLHNVNEIDAISDIHGDPAAMTRVLSAAGLVSASGHWTGGVKVLVITGDTIDKGAHALAVIDAQLALEKEAAAAGGHVVVTLGNHEAEFLADPTASKAVEFVGELTAAGLDPAKVAQGDGVYGQWLMTRPLAAQVDEWFFSHAGNGGGASVASMSSSFQKDYDAANWSDNFLIGTDSVLEARQWWTTGSSSTKVIDTDLAALPAKHIVFGHQPGKIPFTDDPQGTRSAGTMAMRYAGRIFLIDTGMSYAVADSQGALLRIVRGTPTVASEVDPSGKVTQLWSGN